MDDSERQRLISAGARNMAAWHDRQLRAHGLDCRYSGWLWSLLESGPEIFLAAITISPPRATQTQELMEEIEHLAGARPNDNLILCDWWMSLELSPLGFEPDEPAPYYVRLRGHPSAVEAPAELAIEEVSDAEALREFEEASVEGFEFGDASRDGRWHVEASLGDPNMRYFAGRVDGQVVSASIGCVTDGVVGIYGVATRPEFRRRGYGTAMTWAAVQMDPTLPAVLEPSSDAESMYRKMGFEEAGQFRFWRLRRDR